MAVIRMNCRSLITALFCLVAWSSAWPQTWKPVTVPGADVAQRTTGIGWYRCWVKVPDNWATLGGRDLWVESVTLTIDSSHTAHEAYLNGKRLGGAGTFPPDAAAGDGLAKRYKVPPGSLAKGKWNELSIKVFNRDGTGRFRGSGPSIQGYFLECFFTGEWEYRHGHRPGTWPGALGQTKPRSLRPVSRGQPRVVRGTKTRPRGTAQPSREPEEI